MGEKWLGEKVFDKEGGDKVCIIGKISTLPDLRAQLTFPQVVHCQSSAENNPLLFSANCFPILIPPTFTFDFASGFGALHLLHSVLRA